MVDEPEIARVKVTIVADGPALDASLAESQAKISAFDDTQITKARTAQAEMLASLEAASQKTKAATSNQKLLSDAMSKFVAVEQAANAAVKAGNISSIARGQIITQAVADYTRMAEILKTNTGLANNLAKEQIAADNAVAQARSAAAQNFFNDATGVNRPSALAAGATYSATRDMAAEDDAAALAMSKMQSQATRLEAAIHPLNAAYMELGQTTKTATELQEAGIISLEIRDGIIAAATTKYENLSTAMNENLKVSKVWSDQAAAGRFQYLINTASGIDRPSAVSQGATFSALDEAVRAGTLKTMEKDASGAASAIGRVGGASSLTTREIIVLGREAARGDLSRMAGSATLLTQSLFGTSGAVLAVIGGVIAAGVTIGGFTYLVHKGGQELLDFNNSLVATGNAAGITAGQFYTMGTTIHAATGASTDSIRELEMELTRTGKVSSDSMGLMITDAEELAKAMSEKPPAALKQLETLTGDVSKASAELNAQFNFLTESEWLEIRAMDEAGNKAGAMKEALKDLNNHLKDVKDNTGYLESALRSLGGAWDYFVQHVEAAGRTLTVAERLARLKTNLAEANDPSNKNEQASPTMMVDGGAIVTKASVQRQIEYYQMLVEWENKSADAKAKVAEATRQSIADDETYGKKSGELQAVFQAQARTTKELADARAQYAKAITPEAMASAQRLIDTKADVLQGEKNRITQLQKQIAGPQPRVGRTGHDEGETDLAQINKATTALELEDKAQAGLNRSVADGTMSAKEAAAQSQVNAKWAAEVARQTQLRVDIEALGAKNDPKSIALRASLTKSYEALTNKITVYKNELQESAGIKADTQIIAQTQAQDDQNASLELEIQLIGAGNRERAVAIAQAKAIQDLNNLGVDPASRYGKDFISSKVEGANLGADQQSGQYVQNAKDSLFGQQTQLQTTAGAMGMGTQAGAEYTKMQELLNKATEQHIELSAQEIQDLAAVAKGYGDAAVTAADLARAEDAQKQGMDMADAAAKEQTTLDDREKRYDAAYSHLADLERMGVMTHEEAERAKAAIDVQYQGERLKVADDFFGSLATLAHSSNKNLKAIGKDAAIVQATIDAYLAINKALATLPFPINIIEAGAIGIMAFANVESIAGMATGGIVHGVGGPTDDMNLRALSDGEGILTAAGVQNNPGLVEAVNSGAKISVGGGLGSPSVAANWNSSGAGGGGGGAWLKGITVVNNGTPQTYKVDSIDESGVRLIAEDVVRNRAGSQVAADLANPNSKVSQSMTRHVNAPRRTR